MGATYTRQSTFTDGDVITSDLFNNEYDQLLAAFAVFVVLYALELLVTGF